MTTTVLLRLRRFLATYGPTVAAALVVVGLVALGGAWWTFANPPTTEVTAHTNETAIRSSLETQAVVTGQSQLYDPGTTLHNQPVYLQAATPVVTYVHRTTVPSGKPVAVTQRLSLVIEAVHDGDVFWRTNQTLTRTATTTTAGEVVTRSPLNITALKRQLAEHEAAIDGAGSLRAALKLRVQYDTGRYTGTFTKRAPLTLEDTWYVAPTPSTTRVRRTTATQTTTVPRNALSYLAPGAFGALALLGGITTAGTWHYRLREENPARLQRRIDRQIHADWISTGSLDDVHADRSVPMDSLDDIVELGIDMNIRVVHDPDLHVFAVVDEDTVYYYDEAERTGWMWEGDVFGQQP